MRICCKNNSLIACFRKELQKVRQSKKSGAATDDIYHPNLWNFNGPLFLENQEEHPRKTVSNFDSIHDD
jgi:hypothetical protein